MVAQIRDSYFSGHIFVNWYAWILTKIVAGFTNYMLKNLTTMLFFLLSILPTIAFSHHVASESIQLDDQQILTGTIFEIDWRSPHVVLHFLERNTSDNGEIWLLEIGSPKELLEKGITRSILLGESGSAISAPPSVPNSQIVELTAIRKSGDSCIPFCTGYGLSIDLPNGQTIVVYEDVYSMASELKF